MLMIGLVMVVITLSVMGYIATKDLGIKEAFKLISMIVIVITWLGTMACCLSYGISKIEMRKYNEAKEIQKTVQETSNISE